MAILCLIGGGGGGTGFAPISPSEFSPPGDGRQSFGSCGLGCGAERSSGGSTCHCRRAASAFILAATGTMPDLRSHCASRREYWAAGDHLTRRQHLHFQDVQVSFFQWSLQPPAEQLDPGVSVSQGIAFVNIIVCPLPRM